MPAMTDADGVKGPRLPREILNKLQIKENGRKPRQHASAQSRRELRKSARVDKKSRGADARTLRKKQKQQPPYRQAQTGLSSPAESGDVSKHVQPSTASETDLAPASASDTEDSDADIAKSLSASDRESSPPNGKQKLSRTARARLEEDDLEIRRLEKKLGIKGKKRLRPNDSDGLDGILDGLGDEDSNPSDDPVDAEAQAWLRKKRKASKAKLPPEQVGTTTDSEFSGFEDPEAEASSAASSTSDLEVERDDEVSRDSKTTSKPHRTRENPYVPPVSQSNKALESEAPRSKLSLHAVDISEQLRRKIKGLLNRLSEANVLSILNEVESLYSSNARQHVSTGLMDALMFHFDIAGALEDPFVVLHAGFIAGLTKLMGPDFGAEMVKRITEKLDGHLQLEDSAQVSGKAPVNLILLLTELYNFRVISSDLIYDFIREFVNVISEQNTELLLKIVKVSGPQLRQEDPSALKDIVLTLQTTASAAGLARQSVRTRFMVDTIMDLKNNRLKSTLQSSAMAIEHRSRLKKSLGMLPQHKIKTNEPLRVTLSDIRSSESKGKWWVVGARYNDEKPVVSTPTPATGTDLSSTHTEENGVDVSVLAKNLRMNTEVRRAIFVSIMSASDFEDAHQRLQKLHLKKAQEGEISKVLLQCVTGEQIYNPFYTLIASKLCQDKRMRMSFQFALWDTLKLVAQRADDGDEEDSGAEAAAIDVKAVVHLAKMYGYLVAEQRLDVKIVKNIDIEELIAGEVNYVFLEVFLVTIITHCYRTSKGNATERLQAIFDSANELPDVSQGLRRFIGSTVEHSDMVKKSQRKILRSGCEAVATRLVEDGPLDADDKSSDDMEITWQD